MPKVANYLRFWDTLWKSVIVMNCVSYICSTNLWLCSLCNTTTTSKQTLLLHADGKKHRAKARAFHASKQQPVQADKSVTDDAKTVVETGPNDKVRDESNVEVPKLKESSTQNDSKPGNETSAKKKRKLEALGDGKSVDLVKKSRNGTSVDMGNGEVIQGEKTTGEGNLKKEGMLEPHSTSTVENKIKWRKLLRSAFKSVRVLNLRLASFLVFVLDLGRIYLDALWHLPSTAILLKICIFGYWSIRLISLVHLYVVGYFYVCYSILMEFWRWRNLEKLSSKHCRNLALQWMKLNWARRLSRR